MKKQNRLWGMILSICLSLLACNCNVHAAGSGTATLSNPSGTVGSTVTVSGSISTTSKIASAYMVFSYNPAGLQYISGSSGVSGGSGSVKLFVDTVDNPVKSLSFSMNFKILKQGTFKVNFGNVEVIDDADTNQMSIRTSGGSVTGKTPTSNSGGGTTSSGNGGGTTSTPDNRDKNNKLSSLQIHPGTLSPAFSAGTTSYNVTVPADTKEVTISATPQSSKANVTVSGGKDLKLGENKAQVVVVAENGSSIAYTITIMCGQVEQIQIGGNNNTIHEDFTDEQIPTGFTRTKVTYNDRQYEGLVNAKGNLQLMSLKNGENSAFYIYNQDTKEFHTFVQIKLSEGKYIIPLPLNENIVEFKEYPMVPVTAQDKTVDAWKINDEFSVVYAMNQDGEEVLYKYDHVDGTFQRYTDVQIEDMDTDAQKTWFPNEYYMYAIVGLGALCIILLISMIYFIASRKARHEGRKRKAIKRQEKAKAKEEKQRLKEERELEKQREIAQRELERQQAIHEKKAEKQRRKEEKKKAKQKD